MNMLLVTLVGFCVLLVLIGWATHHLHVGGGDAKERLFRAYRALVIAGLFLALGFVANYYLASTGLQRSWGAEKLGRKDPFGWIFAGSGMRSNHLFALIIVFVSFIAVGYFLYYLGLTYQAIRARAWRQDGLHFGLLLLKLAVMSFVAGISLWADTSLLIFRTATMMWTDELATTASSLPSPDQIIARHPGTMGAYLLSIFTIWYPMYIILAEKHFASCMAHFRQASQQWATAKLQAEAAAAQPAPVALATPAPGGGPVPFGPAPVGPAPASGPAGPVGPVPHVGPAGPAPGGAAPWVRSIPFNPGPQNGNGRPRVEV